MTAYQVGDVFKKNGVCRVLGGTAPANSMFGFRLTNYGQSADILDRIPFETLIEDGWEVVGNTHTGDRSWWEEPPKETPVDPRDATIAKLRSLLGEAATLLTFQARMLESFDAPVSQSRAHDLAARLRKESGK